MTAQPPVPPEPGHPAAGTEPGAPTAPQPGYPQTGYVQGSPAAGSPAPGSPAPGYPAPGYASGHPGTFPPVGPAAPTSGRTALSVLAGLVAALVGAVLWAVLVEVTGYKIGFAAVGIGFLVGQAMAMTAGGSRLLPPLGAVLALLGCLLGDTFSDAHEVAKVVDVGTFTVLRRMATDLTLAKEIVKTGFSPMDLLFWGIAAWQGFSLTARAVARRSAG